MGVKHDLTTKLLPSSRSKRTHFIRRSWKRTYTERMDTYWVNGRTECKNEKMIDSNTPKSCISLQTKGI